MRYKPATSKIQLEYWLEYNQSIHALVEECAFIISNNIKLKNGELKWNARLLEPSS